MLERPHSIVINTTPLIAIAVATGRLDVLQCLYQNVIVPAEVEQEIRAAGAAAPGVAEFDHSPWLQRLREPQSITPFLRNSLDLGEAAVIQAAVTAGVDHVCIDEKVGRRVARLHGLTVTGSVGVMAKAKQLGYALDGEQAIQRLRAHGIWLGRDVMRLLQSECQP